MYDADSLYRVAFELVCDADATPLNANSLEAAISAYLGVGAPLVTVTLDPLEAADQSAESRSRRMAGEEIAVAAVTGTAEIATSAFAMLNALDAVQASAAFGVNVLAILVEPPTAVASPSPPPLSPIAADWMAGLLAEGSNAIGVAALAGSAVLLLLCACALCLIVARRWRRQRGALLGSRERQSSQLSLENKFVEPSLSPAPARPRLSMRQRPASRPGERRASRASNRASNAPPREQLQLQDGLSVRETANGSAKANGSGRASSRHCKGSASPFSPSSQDAV